METVTETLALLYRLLGRNLNAGTDLVADRGGFGAGDLRAAGGADQLLRRLDRIGNRGRRSARRFGVRRRRQNNGSGDGNNGQSNAMHDFSGVFLLKRDEADSRPAER